MTGSDRFAVLGVAPVRTRWFADVSRWSNEAAIPVDFVKCVSANEVADRFEEQRAFSALIVDELTPGLDRDLIDRARTRGCAVIVVSAGMVERDWREFGVSALLDERFEPADLVAVLRQWATPLGDRAGPPDESRAHVRTRIVPATTIAVTGPGGTGSSTIAMAIAQGMATEAVHRRLLLADMALHADLALLHDVGDVLPALTELVDAHRLGVPEDGEIARCIHSVPDRGYHLLLGLRHPRDWMSISGRALDETWTSLENLYTTIVADIGGDFDGVDTTGSGDLEDRNRLARAAAQRSDLVVAVGRPDPGGIRRLVFTIRALTEAGLQPARILPCINRAARHPRARAEITRALAVLMAGDDERRERRWSPIFVPDRKALDRIARDAVRLPDGVVSTLTASVSAALRRSKAPQPERAKRMGPGAEPIVPGTIGTWTADD